MTDRVTYTLKKHRKPVFWVCFSLVIVGLVLYLAQDPATVHVESPVSAGDLRFPDYIASLVGAPVLIGDAYTTLHNGDEAYPAMLAAIDGAKTRVNFESYVFNKGEIADRFVDALARAAQRGVVVRIVLDPIGSSLDSESTDKLKAAGAKLAWFNPLGFFSLEDYNYRTHRKTMVVDGDVAFTGGMGVADHWSGHAQDQEHWRDSHFRIAGPAVRALEGSFYENWIETGGLSAPALDPEMKPRATGARSVVVWSNPMTGVSNIKLQYLLAIGAARKTIDIQSPYITLDPTTQWSLDQARQRGVRIRLLAEGDVTDAMPVKHASRYDYQRLLDDGYEVFEYQPTMMHTKAMIVDGIFSIIGSANFGNRSFELNDELTIGIYDAELAAQLTRDFESDIQSSKRLDAKTWPQQRSFDGKINEWFWDFFGEMF
jgi:cardiolipin synthase A/B